MSNRQIETKTPEECFIYLIKKTLRLDLVDKIPFVIDIQIATYFAQIILIKRQIWEKKSTISWKITH